MPVGGRVGWRAGEWGDSEVVCLWAIPHPYLGEGACMTLLFLTKC